MIDEVWKKVPDYDDYEVSNMGKVRSYKKWNGRKAPHIIKPGFYNVKYLCVGLSKNGVCKTFAVHRLVCLAFVGPRPEGMEIAHLDNDPGNNRLSNLKYCTSKENNSHKKIHGTSQVMERHGSAKLNRFQVAEILNTAFLDGQKSNFQELAKKYGVTPRNIALIYHRSIWKSLPEELLRKK